MFNKDPEEIKNRQSTLKNILIVSKKIIPEREPVSE